jgi:hypothetical protein
MTAEEKVKVLEDEFKLIKGELRQTLVSVRDFLLDLKLPPVQEEADEIEYLPRAQSESAAQPESGLPSFQPDMPEISNGSNSSLPSNNVPNNKSNDIPNYEEPDEEELADELADKEDSEPEIFDLEDKTEDEDSFDFEDNDITSGDMPGEFEEEQDDEKDEDYSPVIKSDKEVKPQNIEGLSQMNLLANLMRWTAEARSEIGMDQLPVFLDLYTIGGKLPKGVKEAVLHIAEIVKDINEDDKHQTRNDMVNEQVSLCMEINEFSVDLPQGLKDKLHRLTQIVLRQSVNSTKVEIWSQMMLALHGILTGSSNSELQKLNIENLVSNDDELDWEEVEEIEDIIDDETSEVKNKTVKSAKLKLVFPMDDDKEQEIELGDLTIGAETKNRQGNGRRAKVA